MFVAFVGIFMLIVVIAGACVFLRWLGSDS